MQISRALALLMSATVLMLAQQLQQPLAQTPTQPPGQSSNPQVQSTAQPAGCVEESPKISRQTFKAQINNSLGSATSRENDAITATVVNPDGCLGWMFVGRVKKVIPAKKGSNHPAELELQFENLAKSQSLIIPVHADVVEVANTKGVKGVDEEGNIIGGVSKKKKAMGGIGGALLGAGVGYAAGGYAGMAAGGAAGAALGYALVKMTTKAGSDIRFEKGALFTLEVNSRAAGQTSARNRRSR